jgi:hypothetical protein
MSDLGLLSFYLGIEVHQDNSGISLHQTTYAKRIIELGGLIDCNPAHTPMKERLKLSRDSTAKEVDTTQYRRIVGSLRYLVHRWRDLAFAVGYVSRFMRRPTTEHQQNVKRIHRYVRAPLTTTCTTRGALARSTSSSTTTTTSPTTSTQARAPVGRCSSSASV